MGDVLSELEECLNSLSEPVIEKIASCHGLKKPKRSDLLCLLTDAVHLKTCWKQWNEAEKRVLVTFLLHAPQGMLKERDLLRLPANGLTPSQFRYALLCLCQEGWIYTGRGPNRERFYLCPLELRRGWIKTLIDPLPTPLGDEKEIRVVSAPTMGIWQAMFHFLVTLDQQPCPLTHAGQMSMRYAQKLDVDLDLDPDALAQTKWSSSDFPSWVQLITDLAGKLDLLEHKGGLLKPEPARFQRWLQLSWTEMVSILYQAVRQALTSHWYEGEGYWMIMEILEPGVWYPVRELVKARRSLCGQARPLEAEMEKLCGSLLLPLRELGWIEMGEAQEGACFRWLDVPPLTGDFPGDFPVYVQPDLEIMIPYTFPFSIRYQLAEMADFMGGDRYLRYEINENSIKRACRRGYSPEQILKLLEEWSCFPLPDAVRQKIAHWVQKFDGVLLESAVLVHAPDPSITEKLEQMAQSEFLPVKRWSPTCLSIPSRFSAKVEEWLKNEEKSVSRVPEPLYGRIADEGNRDDWYAPFRIVRSDIMEDRHLKPAEAFPGIRDLPRIWTSGLRAYHPSVQREMLRKCIDRQLDVLLEKKRRLFTVTPQKLKLEAGNWFLEAKESGGKKRKFCLSEIERLQILLPWS